MSPLLCALIGMTTRLIRPALLQRVQDVELTGLDRLRAAHIERDAVQQRPFDRVPPGSFGVRRDDLGDALARMELGKRPSFDTEDDGRERVSVVKVPIIITVLFRKIVGYDISYNVKCPKCEKEKDVKFETRHL